MEGGWNPNAETSPNCPRCGSCNTKFCYYNNYSLTQPRYFCKGCRRYWTKGGSLRNVPVGGGCRRSRRGKSIPLSLHSDPPRFFPYRNDHFTFSGSKLETSNGSPGSNIDIAQVYANFLNPQAESEARVEMTGLPLFGTSDHPSLISQQLSSVSNMHMEFSSNDHHDHLSLENSLLECPYNNNINGSDSIQKQLQENTSSQFTSAMIWNYGLPTWLGEWVPAGSDLMDPNNILDAPQKPEAVGIEQVAQNSDLFVGDNYGNSVYTSMSGHGTLFRPW